MKKILYLTATAALLTAATVSCKETPIVKETKVAGVRLNKTELTLIVGETDTLIASVLPEDADNKAVSWESSDNGIVAVDNNGNITAKEVGTALITATTKDGGKTATCSVTVFCNCIMDTLKGEWNRKIPSSAWYDQFESILKILSQNADGSINYEVVIEDTLSYTGSFQIQYDNLGRRMVTGLKLPYAWDSYKFCFINEWLFFLYPQTWWFYDGAIDGQSFIYQQIKKEE